MSNDEFLERAVDQLVDETASRLLAVRHLLGHAREGPWPAGAIRASADVTVRRLVRSSTAASTARFVLSTLWHTDDPTTVPPSWWSTPLGRLLRHRLAAAAADGERVRAGAERG